MASGDFDNLINFRDVGSSINAFGGKKYALLADMDLCAVKNANCIDF
jgi:hypothetical protein